MQINVTK